MVDLQIWTKSDKNRSLTTDLINDIMKLFTIVIVVMIRRRRIRIILEDLVLSYDYSFRDYVFGILWDEH